MEINFRDTTGIFDLSVHIGDNCEQWFRYKLKSVTRLGDTHPNSEGIMRKYNCGNTTDINSAATAAARSFSEAVFGYTVPSK